MSAEVFVAGAAVHPFGKHRGTATDELGYRAVSELMATAGVDPGLVDVGFGGSVYGGSLLAQRVMQRGVQRVGALAFGSFGALNIIRKKIGTMG